MLKEAICYLLALLARSKKCLWAGLFGFAEPAHVIKLYSLLCRWTQLLWTWTSDRTRCAPWSIGRVRLHLHHQMEAEGKTNWYMSLDTKYENKYCNSDNYWLNLIYWPRMGHVCLNVSFGDSIYIQLCVMHSLSCKWKANLFYFQSSGWK